MAKNYRLECRVSERTKELLIGKAKQMNINLTEFIEKVARESIVFVRLDIINEKGLVDV